MGSVVQVSSARQIGASRPRIDVNRAYLPLLCDDWCDIGKSRVSKPSSSAEGAEHRYHELEGSERRPLDGLVTSIPPSDAVMAVPTAREIAASSASSTLNGASTILAWPNTTARLEVVIEKCPM